MLDCVVDEPVLDCVVDEPVLDVLDVERTGTLQVYGLDPKSRSGNVPPALVQASRASLGPKLALQPAVQTPGVAVGVNSGGQFCDM